MVGLALEGGGAAGAFHIGAVRALLEDGLSFDGVTGTSIGAINGAAIAQGDFEKTPELWRRMNSESLFGMSEAQLAALADWNFSSDTLRSLKSLWDDTRKSHGIDTKNIRLFLEDIIDEQKLRASGVDFGLVTFCLSDFKPCELMLPDIPEGRLVDYILASAYLPCFSPEPMDGKYYVDGGFYNNLPLNLLQERGFSEIYAVHTNAVGVVRKFKADKDTTVHHIYPSEPLVGLLGFVPDRIEEAMQMGYCDAMRYLKKLSGRKYYILSETVPKKFFPALAKVSEKELAAMTKTLYVPEGDLRRLWFEKLLPQVAKKLDLSKNDSYEQIGLALLEYRAEVCGMERFCVRSFDTFIEELKALPNPPETEDSLLVAASGVVLRRMC